MLSDGDAIKDWDPRLLMECQREIEIDLSKLARSGGLKPGAYVSLLPTWWSSGTSLRGRGEADHIQIGAMGGRHRYSLRMVVPGEEVTGTVQLKVSLVLVSLTSLMERDPLAPRRAGSVLWEDSIVVQLEGEAPRFPMSVVDFVQNGLGSAGACWRFDWSPADLTLPAMGTMRLLVNAKHEIFKQALVSTMPSEAQLSIRSSLKHAVAMEMLGHALVRADELEDITPVPGTAGAVFLDLLERVFPGRSPVACREFRASDPAAFGAEVQARLALFSADDMRGISP